MNYQETLDYLFTRLPMYQRDGQSAYKKDLTNTLALLAALENPHQKFRSVHIAGTNGKGTCAHGIAAVLQVAGYKTGLYTSPHLKDFTERIKINGKEVEETFVIEFVDKIRPTIEEVNPSFFEITVAMAFEYFAQQHVDIAVIETGLGGRLDSTNVITPEACLITNIGYDHMDMLGDTLKKIATEKAGIIKTGVPVVIGEYHHETFPVFVEKARESSAQLFLSHDFGPDGYPPEYPYTKSLNREKVRMLAYVLSRKGWEIGEEAFSEGFERMEQLTGLKGRAQVISQEPMTLADVSHNEQGLRALFDYAKPLKKEHKLHLVFGTVRDKDLKKLFTVFPKEDVSFYWTQSDVPRSLRVESLTAVAASDGLQGMSFSNVNEALAEARKQALPEDLIIVTGSTFVVAALDEL